MIKVKEIKWINESAKEAEVILSDGISTVMCFSQPFYYDVDDVLREPLYCYEAKNIMKSYDDDFIFEKQNYAFAYCLRGELSDVAKKLVRVGGFTLSLEDANLSKDLKAGDIIEFTVQRLDIF